MIEGKTKTEATYRATKVDSSSSLKDFSIDRKKYYKKYMLGEDVQEKDNQAITIGRIVETLLLEPEEFDNKFYLSACAKTPTATMLDFVENLYECTIENTDDQGVVTSSFKDISLEAYKRSAFKLSYEVVINRFVGSDAEIYFNEICKVRRNNLTVITPSDVSFAQRIVDELSCNFVTRDIFNIYDSNRYSAYNQFQVHDYDLQGITMKSMIDRIIVDHIKKEINIYDLKCTWNVENFYEEYYLYRRAYIQGFVYKKAIESLTSNENGEWFGYKVNFPKFIVCDSTNYYNPLIFSITEKGYYEAANGFIHKGYTYPGVNSILEDLNWAIENNIWNISKTNYLNNGVVEI